MPYIHHDLDFYVGKFWGESHQCVALVKFVCGAPQTADWKRGAPVRALIPAPQVGTAIATFNKEGEYDNKTDGSSHAAIFLSRDGEGIWVLDQWVGQPTHKRLIGFHIDMVNVHPANNANCFYVIEEKPKA
jgi:hypothetical protein